MHLVNPTGTTTPDPSPGVLPPHGTYTYRSTVGRPLRPADGLSRGDYTAHGEDWVYKVAALPALP